jgi:hypothetical protein
MEDIEPDLVELLTVLDLAGTTLGQEAIAAFNAAEQAVANWKSGLSAQDVIQLINAFTTIFNALPFPLEVSGLVDAISAGIVVVIGILTGNSPASAGVTQVAHEDSVLKDTETKVQSLLPGFKRSMFHSISHQWTSAWQKQAKAAAKLNPKYAVLVN